MSNFIKRLQPETAICLEQPRRLVWCWLCCFVCLTPGMLVAHDNWPQWRGPGWNGVSTETTIPVEFGREKNLLWRVPMPGAAGSSPIVWGEQVFVTSVDGDLVVLLCYGTDGKLQWQQALGGKNRDSRDGANSAAPSPMTDGTHVWATSGAGVLHCFTMKGAEVWKLDLQEKYGEFDIQFGMASTPILDRGRLYLQLIHGDMRTNEPSVGTVVALEAKTGAEVWQQTRKTEATKENKHSYASPTLYRDDQREYLLTHGADYLMAHSLEDGSELWRMGGMNEKETYNEYLRFVSSPTCIPGMIVVPSAKSGPVLCLRPDQTGNLTEKPDAVIWKLERGTPDVATPVIHEGLVYFCRENGVLLVLDVATGETTFNERLMEDRHRSSPVIVGDKLIIAGRKGDVLVVQTGREPKLLATNSLGEELTASPAVADGRVYIRTFDALYAFGSN